MVSRAIACGGYQPDFLRERATQLQSLSRVSQPGFNYRQLENAIRDAGWRPFDNSSISRRTQPRFEYVDPVEWNDFLPAWPDKRFPRCCPQLWILQSEVHH